MKRNFLFLIAILFLGFGFSGCLKDKCQNTMTYMVWKPVVKPLSDIRAAIASSTPVPLKNPGQMYLFGKWLLIGEIGEGIHIFDNSNPDIPVNTAFINLPGNVDMAVKDGFLYADNYMDLVTINISNPLKPVLTTRLENVFPYNFNANGCIIKYEQTQETQTVDCGSPKYGVVYYMEDCANCDVHVAASYTPKAFGGTNGAPNVGVGSSMARFTLANDHLYSVDYSSLRAFDVTNTATPVAVGSPVSVDFHVETLFSLGNRLFVGSNNGTFMYDVTSNADNPAKVGEFKHARSCDPVVADDKTAYITLHDGSACLGFENQLDVVDITQISDSKLIKTYTMKHPLGLGVKGNLLFVCDEGLKVYDNSDLAALDQHLIGHITDINPTDVIPVPWSNDIILVDPTGIYQYDASNPAALRQRSVISIAK